jgi:4-oxalocrotonate tautomerase
MLRTEDFKQKSLKSATCVFQITGPPLTGNWLRLRSEFSMPIITVKVALQKPVMDLEQRVAGLVADNSARILRKKPELTAVIVERVDPKSWFAGGRSLADQRKASFWLEIKVVDGTNTKDQKEAFIADTFARMGDLLGDLHEESYIHVDEVSADAYGFGGLTQERRYIADRLQVAPASIATAA